MNNTSRKAHTKAYAFMIEGKTTSQHVQHRVRSAVEQAGLELQCSTDETVVLNTLKKGSRSACPLLILIAPEVESPINLARQLHQLDPVSQIIFFGNDHEDAELHTLNSPAAMVGTQWGVIDPEDQNLPAMLHKAARSAHQRRQHRTTLDQFNVQLSSHPRADVNAYRRYAVSDRFLANILENARVAIIATNTQGVINTWNHAAEKIFKLSQDDAIGRPIHTVAHGDWSELLARLVSQIKTGILATFRQEIVCQCHDGRRIDVELDLNPVYQESGRLIGISLVVRDISARKRAAERFRLAVEAAPNAMLMVNHEGKIILVNSETERIFGYAREELYYKKVEMLVPKRLRAPHPQYDFTFFADYENEQNELCALRKDGNEFPIELGLNPIETDDELLLLSAITDISERKRAEKKLKRQKKKLEKLNENLKRSNAELEDFAYIASHDLKEPLRGIHNYSVFLQEDFSDKLNDEGKEILATMQRLTKRMEELIDSLLYYSRFGRIDLSFRETDLNTVLSEELDSLHLTIENENIDIRIPQKLPTVKCDVVRVREVFRNLITNAIKYNQKPERWIEIGSYIKGKKTVFYVKDNGIGIREKHLNKIFRIFKRLHGRDKYGGGAGVGLTIVKKIIERHGGEIWVESTVGEGTTFYFTLD